MTAQDGWQRWCDRFDKSHSGVIRRSLNGLASNPRMASRDWYEQEIRQRGHQGRDTWELAELDAGFDIFAAPGQPFIDAGSVKQDSTTLDAVISRVNTYTSKTIAHRDDTLHGAPADLAVTWAEPDAALDAGGTSTGSTTGYATPEKRSAPSRP
jgi:hypothetical protein